MPAQTRHRDSGEQSPSRKRLEFREKLVQKGSSTDVLTKKLKGLYNELSAIDQEQIEVDSLSNVRKELINTSIFHNKNTGVKAYAACCLADILRLYAPDAPYTQPQLRDIFQFFFQQLSKGLKSQDATYYNECFHVLESLSTVKSVVLVCDLPNSEALIEDIFKCCFDLMKHDTVTKKVEILMADVLVAIIDEAQTVSSDLLELMLEQFTDKPKGERGGHRLAVQVFNQTADKLQRRVAVYFSEILLEHDEEDDNKEDVARAHVLMERLHETCPGVLHGVIPQLEEELQMELVKMRGYATHTLGKMFGDKHGPELYKNFSSTWTTWLSRSNDKSSIIRLKFVESSKDLYSTTVPEMRTSFEAVLGRKFLDPDEKVRAAVCKLYSELDYETVAHHVSHEQLKGVLARVADRKAIVRQLAATSIGRLYTLAHPEIENSDAVAIEKFSWIPGELLGLFKFTECRPAVEIAFYDHILALPDNSPSVAASTSKSTNFEAEEIAWTNRLLTTILYIPEGLMDSFLNLTNLQKTRPTSFEAYLDACVKNNGGVIDEDEEKIKQRLDGMVRIVSASFPDPLKAAEDLRMFAKMNEPRLYKLLKTCMDVTTDLKSLVKATTEFNRRLQTASSSIVSTMSIFLRRASLRIINSSSVPTLLKTAQHGKTNGTKGRTITKTAVSASHAQILLTWIAKYLPQLFSPHVGKLLEVLEDGTNEKVATIALHALAEVARIDTAAGIIPDEQETIKRVRDYALGPNRRHAKFAARFLIFCGDKEQQSIQLSEAIAQSLDDLVDDSSEQERLVAHLTVLDQLVRFNPEAFEHRSDVITAFLLKKLLMVSDPAPDDGDEEDWLPNEDLTDRIRAKIIALKIFRHRSLTYATSKRAIELSTPVLKLLATLVDQEGALVVNEEQDRKMMARMRLQAAVSLLHLSTVDIYAAALTPRFLKLVLTVQDPCFEVRHTFITKAVGLLVANKLSERFNVIPFLTVHDPEEEVKQYAASYVSAQLKRLLPTTRVKQFDYVLIRLLHTLAHHPDFHRTAQGPIVDMAKYIQFFLSMIANQETISLLYHLANKGKTVQDSESETYTENLYVLCDITQELLRARAQQNNWNIQSYPGKVKLPSDILRPHPNAEASNLSVKQTYLSDEAIAWLAEVIDPSKEKKERKPPKRKVPSRTTNGHTKRSRKKKRRSNADADDDEDEGRTDQAETSDVDMTDPVQQQEAEEVEEDPSEEEEAEEKLGRGARTRAKAKAKKHAAKKKVAKPDPQESD